VRTAYKCRAYPDLEQASVLNRTFGCIQVVWNRTLAWRRARYSDEQARTNFTQANAYLTAMKAGEELDRRERNLARYQKGSANRAKAKAKAGRHLIVIDRWYPSSKTCSACGHLLAELSLSTRTWQCPSCGTRHDRDVNAAKNILAAGLTVTACGADVRHSGSSRVQSAVKQEPRPVTAGIPVLQGRE
jgi:transposase